MNMTLQDNGGAQTVLPPQVVYLDFDGEVTSYRGEILTIDEVVVEDSGLSAAEIGTLIERLNEACAGAVLFVGERPEAGDYSTVFIGHTDAFSYRGLAETIDHGNRNRNDNAFVNLRGGESLEEIQQIISHEVGHLTGTLDHGGEGIAQYTAAANYYVSSGVTTIGVSFDHALMDVYDGGCVSNTTVNSSGWLHVFSGGTATHTTINYSGWLSAYAGGIANHTTINSNGRMYLSDNGRASDTIVNSSGWLYVSSGGSANGTTVNAGGWLSAYAGGVADNTAVNSSGGMLLSDNGRASRTVVNSSGRLYVSSAGTANGTTVNAGGEMHISSAGTANNTTVNSDGTMSVADGGKTSGAIVNNKGKMYLSSGARAENTVLSGGEVFGHSGGLLDGSTMYAGFIYLSGGTAANTAVHSGTMEIDSGAVASRTTLHSGSLVVYGGGSATNTTVSSGAYLEIESGWAQGVNLKSDGRVVNYGGQVLDISQAVGGRIGVRAYGGNSRIKVTGTNANGSFFLSNGVAENFIVYSGGDLDAMSGGIVNHTVLSGGGQWVFEGSVANHTIISGGRQIVEGAANQTVIYSGSMTILNGGIADSTTIHSGGMQKVSSGGVANNTVIGSGGEQTVEGGGVAGQTTIHRGGIQTLQGVTGGREMIAGSTMIHDGGLQQVYSNGVAVDTVVSSGGHQSLHKGAAASNTTVMSGGMLTADDLGISLQGQIILGGNMTVKRDVDAANTRIVFAVNQRQRTDSAIIDDISLIQGASYSITVNAAQGTGSYKLAGGASAFSRSVTVKNVAGAQLGTLTAGGSLETGGMQYSLKIDNAGTLTFAIAVVDKEAPTITNIKASATAPTNQNVTVTADFADNVALASKQYRIDSGAWLYYVDGVTMTANGTVYFKAVDTAGNVANKQYTVANIDKVAPTITGIAASKTAPTNQNVTVTANFADNVALASKQYKLGSGSWQNYTGAVTVTANTTVYFKAVDTAGNEANTQYAVSNIDKIAPTITNFKASATAPTNRDVTVTVVFADNVALASKQYKIGNGSWQNYTNGVTMTANNTIYFKAVDTAGNETNAQYAVAYIDKVAPDAPTLSVSPFNRTNGTVSVTAKFASDVVKKEYSLDGVNWLSYTKAVAVASNTTIRVRGYDEAGNSSDAEYKITNIVPLDPKGPSVVLLTPKVKKYNVTVKWAKPATQDKAKIAGYEIEYNGTIFAVKKASLSLKNVAVSTGNTIQVRAVDSYGRYGALSQVFVFDVRDVTAPKLGKVTAAVNGYTGTIAWSGSDNVGIVKYVVNCAGQSQTVTSGVTAKFDNLAVGKYKATVQAFDAAGNASKRGKVSITVKDVTAPEKVAGLIVPLIDNKYKALLWWTPGKDNSNKITRYEIKLDNGKIFKTSKNSLKVSKLSVGTHTYQVRAIDPSKNAGAWSDVQTFTVKDMTAPAAVSVKADVGGNSLLLTWKTPKDNVGVTGYILKHGVNLEKTETLTASQLNFRIDGIAKGTYRFQIVAVDAAGNQSKAKSGKATIKTDLPVAAMSLELPEAIPSLAFDAGVSANSSGLHYDDPLAFCSTLQTESDLRLTAADLFASDSEKKSSSLLAAAF